VRRVIRNTRTGEYYSQAGWTPDQTAAESFSSLKAIAELQLRIDLKEAEIVLQIGPEPSKEYDVHLRLPPTSRSGDAAQL
jgi:hypothetical protein